MTVFDYDDYKQCVNDWISQQKNGGHGQLRKLSLHLGINSVVMTQVFRGPRDLSLEQALGTATFMGLTEAERDFFLLLVQWARAGTHELKSVFKVQIREASKAAQNLKNRIQHEKFTDEDRATFYSRWYYSAVRLGVSIDELGSAQAIADHLRLNRLVVHRVLQFLLKHRLIVEKNGRLDIGPQVTHIGHDSPFVNRHHTNWRLQAMKAMDESVESDLFYTGPMALSKVASAQIRKSLLDLVDKSTKSAASSKSETLRCLNIDWFAVEGSSKP